jgi:hypothetical protein
MVLAEYVHTVQGLRNLFGTAKYRTAFPTAMRKGVRLVVAAIVAAAVVAAAAWYVSSGPKDSDGDGVPDATDAFPNNPDQKTDMDADGYGDNPDGDHGDSFPSDPAEWADSDGDTVGDNADVYDVGDGAVRIVIQELALFDFQPCGADVCDVIFRFRVDVDGADPFGPACTADSSVYTDVESILTEPGASVTCDVDERATAVLVEIIGEEDGGTKFDYAPTAGVRYLVDRFDLPPSGYHSGQAYFPYDGPAVRLDTRAEMVGF